MRSTGELAEELRHLGPGGQVPAPGRRGARTGGARPASAAACSTSSSGGIDGGALGQRGALAPPLALLGDHAHEEQRAHAVHAGGGADLLAERDVDPDQLDAGELHGAGAPTPSP